MVSNKKEAYTYRMQLRIPGPTPCPPDVLQSLSKQMINHRGKEFHELIQKVTGQLKNVFQTKNDVLILASVGTGCMEAAIVNFLSPGDKVLSVTNGVFGNRFADIAQQFGADVQRLSFEWGKPDDPDTVRKALKANPAIKAVLITQNESSTGVCNDVKALASVAKEYNKLVLVDAVSGLGAIDLKTDAWNCDIVVTASQKAWMIPPGIAMISISPEAWIANNSAKMPRYYFDLKRVKKSLEINETPFTPAITNFYGLDVALNMMLKEGIENIFSRHTRIGKLTRQGVKEMGLSLFADESSASNTVTAIYPPEGINPDTLRRVLREKYQVILSGGQQDLSGKIFRIGHLGWVNDDDIKVTLKALKEALSESGFNK